ncbi:hypothetical protein COCON_G00217540 [Conger conger]|uniref:Uncharacterized protein n=1 Tax=Conger conger TaxID=82655 RepID=A0A9Q1CXJ5_CONCO|nr:hypothetical protein COCON_G00217540 [Conger conger]
MVQQTSSEFCGQKRVVNERKAEFPLVRGGSTVSSINSMKTDRMKKPLETPSPW